MASIRYAANAISVAQWDANTAPYNTSNIAGQTNLSLAHFSLGAVAASGDLQGFFLYQGTPMTQTELDAITFQTDITKSPRYSDLLFYSQSAISGGNTVVPKAGTALKAGTATWALIGEMKRYLQLCLFTVSAVGGGGEIELQSTDIQTGVRYLFGAITLLPKLSFSW